MSMSIYEIIEQAASADKPIVIPNGTVPIRTVMITPTKFVVDGVYWRWEDGNVYQPVIEAQFRSRFGVAAMYVAGSVSLDWASSGETRMFRPEFRYRSII